MNSAPATATSAKPLPPGRLGLPWIGETLPFLKDTFKFFETRHAEHGPVFKTRLLGETVVCLVGPEAVTFFYDPRYFTRVDASPPQLREILHPDAIPFIDQSPKHAARRQLLLQAFTPEARAGYVPLLERIVLRHLAEWEKKQSFAWVPEIQALCFDVANTLFAGADPDVSDRGKFAAFSRVNAGFLAPPIKLPFTKYGRALAARDELRRYVHERVSAAPEAGATHVLARLRTARTPSGEAIDAQALAIETLHFFFAAFSAVSGALINMGIALADHPEVADRVRKEVRELAPAGPLDPARLGRLTYLAQTNKEVRRYYKLIPATFFARVKEDCEVHGYSLPAGTKAIACLHATMHDAGTFASPETFDPDRFAPGAAGDARPNRFIPHGGGPWDGHRCVGETLAEMMIQVYTTLLVRGHRWELLSRDRTLTAGDLVPTPRDGLPVRFSRTRE